MGRLMWHKREHDAAIAGMMGLSLEERGAYTTILDLIYSRGGGIVDGPDLHRILGCDIRVWRRVRTTLLEKGKIFINEAGLINNARCVKELARTEVRPKSAGSSPEVLPKSNGAKSKNNDLAKQKKKTESEIDLFEESSLQTKPDSPPSPPSGGANVVDFPKRKRSKRAEATMLPDDFALTPDMLAYAGKIAKWDRQRAEFEFDRFCSHHRFRGTKGINWVAGWQMWVRNGLKFDERDNGRPQFRVDTRTDEQKAQI